MLDLKSKLLAAGFVTQEQVEKVDREKLEQKKKRQRLPFSAKQTEKKKKRPPPQFFPNFEAKQREKQLTLLKSLPKNEQYEMIRRWVERNRLDTTKSLSENTERYFFPKGDGSVGWLTLEFSLHALITDGKAAIMAYMSHHGLAHCVIPKDIAEDVAEVFPLWLRILKEHPLAGQVDNTIEEPKSVESL